MSIRACVAAALLAALAGSRLGAPLSAQSLGSLAKQEEERRKAIKEPSKVLTNKDLPDVPPPVEPAEKPSAAAKDEGDKGDAPSAAAAAESKEGTEAATQAAEADEPSSKTEVPKTEVPKTEVKDAAYWSGRLKTLQTQLGRDQMFADALQTRINVLNADFANRDDPVQRTSVGLERQKAIDELGRLNKQIADDRKAIGDLQEEARRAGAPPGWLR